MTIISSFAFLLGLICFLVKIFQQVSKGLLLFGFDFAVPFISRIAIIENGNLHFVLLLHVSDQTRILTEELKGICQLDLGVGEDSLPVMTLSRPTKINPGAQRLPYVFVESLVSTLSFRSRKIVRCDYEDSVPVTFFELLIEPFAYRRTFSFKEELSDMKCISLESICETEFFTGDNLSDQIWPISFPHWHIVASPINFITCKDSSKLPDKLRFSRGSYTIYPGH